MRIGIATTVATAIAIGVIVASTGGGSSACALPNYPDATCTGYPSGQSFTASGGITINANNATYDGYHFTGSVTVNATGVTIKNSWIENSGLYALTVNPNKSVTVQDTEIECGDNAGTKGVFIDWDSVGTTLTRVNIHGCEDGIYASQAFTFQDSWLHDLAVGADSHNDGIQIDGAKTYSIIHNRIAGVDTSAINNCNAANSNCEGIHDVLIKDNLLSGGAYTLYCPIPATTNFVVQGNHWLNNTWAFGTNTSCSGVVDGGGNVIHETNAPVSLNT